MINNITNLLAYYIPTIAVYQRFGQLSTGTIDDIESLHFNLGKYTYTIQIDSNNINYTVYDNQSSGHNYQVVVHIDDPLTHTKLYTMYLKCRQRAWDNFLKDTEVPIPESAGFDQLMD